MSAVVAVFHLYRFLGEDDVWWRLVSPNGRGLARAVASSPSVAAARDELAGLMRDVETLETVIRLTADYRWRWSLRRGAVDVAQGVGEQDRRVRCLDACQKFVRLAGRAQIAPTVAVYRRAGSDADRQQTRGAPLDRRLTFTRDPNRVRRR